MNPRHPIAAAGRAVGKAMNLALTAALLGAAGGTARAKDRRTYFDEPMLSRMRGKLARHEWARNQAQSLAKSAQWLARKSDEELWDFVPPPEQLRAINVCIGHDCPFCGDKITRQAGHYPWKMDRDKPFKVTCPVCKRTFPENDFEPWNTAGLEGNPETGERIVDQGLGWVGSDGRRYYFVSYFIFWQRWVRDILGGMATLSRAYVVTGDAVFGRKCAILLAKVASMYGRFDYRKQGYHEGRFNVPGRISDRIWSTGDDTKIALAYDAVFPIFDDPELLAFLAGKGIGEPRRLIEKDMLYLMVDDVMSGRVAGNMGMHQHTLCCLAIVLDNHDPDKGPTTAAMRDWIMSGPGRVEDLLWNGFWREGLGSESSPSYSSSWCRNFYRIAELLPKLGVDIWGNPKLKKMADVGIDTIIAGRFSPDIGDSGGLKGSGPIALSAELQGRAFTRYGDPRHAQALARIKATSRDLFNDWFDEEEVARVVADRGTEIELNTRNLGGYGLAILEGGTGEQRRGVSMYYGYAGGGHGHHDRLNIQMWAFGRPMLPEDGYPFPFTRPDFWRWRNTDTVKHYCVVVDESVQTTQYAGQLNTLAATPSVQLMDASAEEAYPQRVSLYRRTSALIDISPANSYLLDIFRVRGGTQHDWSFHGPAFFQLSLEGGGLGPARKKGTLAGRDVPFGHRPNPRVRNGFAPDLRDGEGLLGPGPYRELSRRGWALFGECVLTRKPGSSIRVPVRDIPAGPVRLFLRIYDYNKGKNEVRIELGGSEAVLECSPSGTVGYRWISAAVDLAEAPAEAVLTGTIVGQTYIQTDACIISRDADSLRPPPILGETSGYHGLYNVRRMRPAGDWLAKWRKADEDLSLTMRMPAGCVAEVVVADASPELQPGNPETIQYVLGRNLLSDEEMKTGRELFSKYVAVIEPHRGAASIQDIDYLRCATAGPETVGLLVRRQGAIDLVHSATNAEEQCRWEGGDEPFQVAAEFALITLGENGIERAVVVNGTMLRYGDFSLQPEPPTAGTVVAVDAANNSIRIDAELANPDALKGRVILLGNDLHQSSHTIARAERVGDGTAAIHFGDALFIVGMGVVEGTDAAGGWIQADRPLVGYGRVDGGRHDGRWLYNADRTEAMRIITTEGRRFRVDTAGRDPGAVFRPDTSDGRRIYWISDVGPGDTCRIPAVTYYARTGPDKAD